MLEVCVDTLKSARNAISGGAGRLELCSALSEGGLTPTPGLTKLVKRVAGSVPIYAMLRIRGGDFIYSREEADAILEDLSLLRNAGADGFVFGALTPDGAVDAELCREIVKTAHPLPVTFHRAFDDAVTDGVELLETVIDLGFKRILTSGRETTALEGMRLIAELVRKANGRIVVMPGAGIGVDNLSTIRDKTEAEEFHASAKKWVENKVDSDRCRFFGNTGFVTDEDTVRKMVQILRIELS